MKTEILNTIKNPHISDAERFNLLFDFYKKSTSKNRNYEATFNRIGYSDHYLKKLIYEVRQVYKISDVELFQHQFQSEIREPWGFCETPEVKCNMNYCDENGCQNRERHLVDDSEFKENTATDETVPLREEFSFLNEDNCPPEYKILVADKISAYHKMVAGRGALDDPNTPEEKRAEIAQAVAESDQLNSLIYDELKHYQDTGEILGKHEIFATYNLIKNIELMTAEAKVQRVETLKGQIRTNKANLTKANKAGETDKAESLASKIKQLETERDLVIKSLEKSNN